MQSKIESIKRLSSPKHKVSCHYLIDRKGQILKMVDENKIAWHAGKSKWKNFDNLNKNSIGIEFYVKFGVQTCISRIVNFLFFFENFSKSKSKNFKKFQN